LRASDSKTPPIVRHGRFHAPRLNHSIPKPKHRPPIEELRLKLKLALAIYDSVDLLQQEPKHRALPSRRDEKHVLGRILGCPGELTQNRIEKFHHLRSRSLRFQRAEFRAIAQLRD